MSDPNDCPSCDGFGSVWNNADNTSGQRTRCADCYRLARAHTAGPWFVINEPVVAIVGQEDHPVICELTCLRDSGDDGDEIDANARLIAAAPDLLEALILLEKRCGPNASDGAIARAAITKTRITEGTGE